MPLDFHWYPADLTITRRVSTGYEYQKPWKIKNLGIASAQASYSSAQFFSCRPWRPRVRIVGALLVCVTCARWRQN